MKMPFRRREAANRLADVGGQLERAERELESLMQTHNELSAAYELVCGALRSVGDGVEVCDARGNVVFSNLESIAPSAEPFGELKVRQAVKEVLAAAAEGRAEHRHVDLFGPPRRSIDVSGGSVLWRDRALGSVAVVHDVSDRERIDAIRRDFVSNISHELRTPVGAMAALAETMAGESSVPVLQRLAKRVDNEAQRLGRTISDLLSLAHIEAADEPGPEPCLLSEVVAMAVERVGTSAAQRQIELLPGAIPAQAMVIGDRLQLVTALTNLLDNAIKYSDPGSTVAVNVEIGSDCADRPTSVSVSVTDAGIGIPTRDRERIFERFYRVDRGRARDTGGTGLGLAIVRHVAVNHGGEVSVRSVEGHGSTFTLTIPAPTV